MPKLHLKRTPAEEAERAWKKARKEQRRSSKRSTKHSQHRAHDDLNVDDIDNEEEPYGPQPAEPSTSTESYEDIRARLEEERFAERLREARDDDEFHDTAQRLHSMENHMNSYAHIPRRWRGMEDGFSAAVWMEDAAEDIGLEPWQMNDEEYSEYIRAGMWRKKHGEEYKERKRKKIEREARADRARILKDESTRLDREARLEHDRRKGLLRKRRLEHSRSTYEEKWKVLLNTPAPSTPADYTPSLLTLVDIPWPLRPLTGKDNAPPMNPELITTEAINEFLFDDNNSSGMKDILRATMLRFHPDKFEGRILSRVRDEDKERVREIATAVARALNTMLEQLSKRN